MPAPIKSEPPVLPDRATLYDFAKTSYAVMSAVLNERG
jgi:hypothetical protein